MTFPLVDYHCHLDLYPDFTSLVDQCENNKIYTLAVTTTPKAFPRNQELMLGKRYVRAALGLHPQLVASRAAEIDIWLDYLNKTRYIGEIGLDAGAQYYKSFDLQKEIFKTILDSCTNAGSKILSIHSVRSVPVVLDMIEKSQTHKKNGIVLHWFSGTASNLKKAADLGCYFSVNSEMLRNERSKNLVKQIPIQQLLTETDGPFTQVDQLPARPINIETTIDLLSSLLKLPSAELRELIHSNLLKLES